MSEILQDYADFTVGPGAVENYSRLSYTLWHAFAEFIDNSTQSRLNYGSIINDVLKSEGSPLLVEIFYKKLEREIVIKDNSIGMTKQDLIEALKIAVPTKDSHGRSKYGMGMKTAACWIGAEWQVITAEWSSGEEWTATVKVEDVVAGKKIPLSMRKVDPNEHYTKIVIRKLHRNIQQRTEETIRAYLGSMYRFDIASGELRILYDGKEIKPPEGYEFDTDPEGKPMKMDIPSKVINGKPIRGWVAVLNKGGRRFGGFSLFQKQRQIQGYPNAWKPKKIFGGLDDEGANNLVAQRLIGVIEMDEFKVSHTKDAILFEDNEEEDLEDYLAEVVKDYRNHAIKRRGSKGQPWSREKVRDLLAGLRKEFSTDEMRDAVNSSMLPPLDTILKNNRNQLASITPSEQVAQIDVLPDLRVIVSFQEKSEYEPHLTIVAGADPNTVHVIMNALHPYYCALESSDSVEECVRQYIFDAISEYRVSRLTGKVNTDSVRRIKNDLLRVDAVRVENAAAAVREGKVDVVVPGKQKDKT